MVLKKPSNHMIILEYDVNVTTVAQRNNDEAFTYFIGFKQGRIRVRL